MSQRASSSSPTEDPAEPTEMSNDESNKLFRKRLLQVGGAFYFYMLAYAISGNVTPQIILDLCNESYSDAGFASGILYIVNALGTLATAPLLGYVSDCIGRVPIMIISLVGFSFDMAMFGIAAYFNLSVWILVISRTIGGMTNVFGAMAYAYLADITTPEGRSKSFGAYMAVYGFAAIFGPTLSGYLEDQFGTALPIALTVIVILLGIIYIELVLPESRTSTEKFHLSWKKVNPFQSFGMLLECYLSLSTATVFFMFQAAEDGVGDIFLLYLKLKFSIDPVQLGLVLGVIGFCFIVVQGGILPISVKLIGEKLTIIVSLVLDSGSIVLYTFAPNAFWLYPVVVIRSVAFMGIPVCQGLISKQYPQERQGELFGVLTGMQQVASAVGPLIFSNLFSYYTSNGAWPSEDPDIVFYISAVVFTASLLLAMVSFYFLQEKRVVGGEVQVASESDGEEGLDKQKLFTGTEANGGGVMKRNYEALSMRIESARLSQGIPFSIQDE